MMVRENTNWCRTTCAYVRAPVRVCIFTCGYMLRGQHKFPSAGATIAPEMSSLNLSYKKQEPNQTGREHKKPRPWVDLKNQSVVLVWDARLMCSKGNVNNFHGQHEIHLRCATAPTNCKSRNAFAASVCIFTCGYHSTIPTHISGCWCYDCSGKVVLTSKWQKNKGQTKQNEKTQTSAKNWPE